MNLKGFHIVFIVASAALAAMLGVWCVRVYLRQDGMLTLASAAASFAAVVGLVVYGSWFIRKTRHIR